MAEVAGGGGVVVLVVFCGARASRNVNLFRRSKWRTISNSDRLLVAFSVAPQGVLIERHEPNENLCSTTCWLVGHWLVVVRMSDS